MPFIYRKLHVPLLHDKRCLAHFVYLYQANMTSYFMNGVVDTKIDNYVIIASLKSEPTKEYQVRVFLYHV